MRASNRATAYTFASGFTGTFAGKLDMGCHTLSHSTNTTAPRSPAAPPITETSTASVSSWRRMRLRLDPKASRRAISLDRSAARAAERLPRFAHAAGKISPASSIVALKAVDTRHSGRLGISNPNRHDHGCHHEPRNIM